MMHKFHATDLPIFNLCREVKAVIKMRSDKKLRDSKWVSLSQLPLFSTSVYVMWEWAKRVF